jgi:hypothetical protein
MTVVGSLYVVAMDVKGNDVFELLKVHCAAIVC